MTVDTKIYVTNNLTKSEKAEWIKLFCRCFQKSEKNALRIFRKYELNRSKFCLVYKQNVLAACYSGIYPRSIFISLFLSTDTMSSGLVKGGSVIAAKMLYDRLRKEGVQLVCGYPNSEIEGLRIAKLNWKFSTYLDVFIVPFFLEIKHQKPLFEINRPAEGFYGRDYPFVQLGNYRKFAPFRMYLGNKRPHNLSIRLCSIFPKTRKKFFYCILQEINHCDIQLLETDLILDCNSIDVP